MINHGFVFFMKNSYNFDAFLNISSMKNITSHY
jgi:hypothetical protein